MVSKFFARFFGKSNLVKTLREQLNQTRLQQMEALQLQEYATHTVAMLTERETRLERQIVMYEEAVATDEARQRQMKLDRESEIKARALAAQKQMEASLGRPEA